MGSKNPTVRRKMPLETVKCYGGGEYLFGTSKVAIEKHQPSFDRGSQVILIGDFQAFLEHTSSPRTRTMISLANQKDKSISSNKKHPQ